MTASQRQAVGNWYSQAKEIVQLAGGLILILGACIGFMMWMTGGLKPQTQVAADDLTRTVNSIKDDLADIKSTLKVLPSPYEVQDQRAHFARLDDRMGKVEVTEGSLDARVTALEHPMIRQPR